MEPSSRPASADASPERPADAHALALLPPVILPDGGRAIHVAAAPGRPTVLFLHGWVMNRSAWAAAAQPLVEHGFGVVCPDLAGHGDAKPLPSSVRPRAFFPEIARRLLAGLDTLGIGRFSLAGYSMGAAAALAILDAAPGRAERTFLLGPLMGPSEGQLVRNSWSNFSRFCGNIGRALKGPHAGALLRAAPGLGVGSSPLPDAWVQRAADAIADGERLPYESAYASYVEVPPSATELEVFLDGLRRTDLRTTLRSLRASRTLPYRKILSRESAPITFATGSLDALAPPAFVERLVRLTPAARGFELIPDADHVALSQAPAEVTRLLLGWLGEQPSMGSLHAVAASDKVIP